MISFLPSFVFALALIVQDMGVVPSPTTSASANPARSDVLIRYYRNGIGLHHKASGEFAYCQVCLDGLDQLPPDEVIHDAYIMVDFEQGTIRVFGEGNRIVKGYSLGEAVEGTPIAGIGYAYGYYPRDNQDFSYLGAAPGDGGPVVLEMSCQCVPVTSPPCGPNGEDVDCDVGGEGATSCGVSEEAGAGVVVGATGTNVSGGKGCSIFCQVGDYYACCNY